MSDAAHRFHDVHGRLMSRIDGYHGPQLFMDICEICESEIEKMLVIELLDLFCPSNPVDTWLVPAHQIEGHRIRCLETAEAFFGTWLEDTACLYAYGPRPRVVIFSQLPIGRMRIDFVVMADDSAVEPTRSMVAIECDGHDYHERTKEQAARDRSKDRALTAARIPIFRFTGSEIWNGAHECMLEVENFLWRDMFGRDCPLRKYDEEGAYP